MINAMLNMPDDVTIAALGRPVRTNSDGLPGVVSQPRYPVRHKRHTIIGD